MRRESANCPIGGTVVIGEGERDEAPDVCSSARCWHRKGPEGRHPDRSARRHHALRQEHAGRDRDYGDGERRCSTRPTSTWRKSRSAPAIRRTWSTLMLAGENIMRIVQGQGCRSLRNNRAHSRPHPPRRHDRGRAQDRRGGSADHQRRRRRRDPHRAAETPPASTFIWVSAARRRACWPAALTCIGGQDAVPAGARH